MSGGGSNKVLESMAQGMGNLVKSTSGTSTSSIASTPSRPGAPTLTDTGPTPPSGTRPTGPTQFYQPVYQPSYAGMAARSPGVPDVASYGLGVNPFAYQPQSFQPTMPTAQQAMGPVPAAPQLPQPVAQAAPQSQGIAALPKQ